MKELKFNISGMHCESCEKLIKMDLEEIDGIKEIDIDSKTGIGNIKVEESVTPELIIKTIGETGYKAKLMEENNE